MICTYVYIYIIVLTIYNIIHKSMNTALRIHYVVIFCKIKPTRRVTGCCESTSFTFYFILLDGYDLWMSL